MGQKHLYLLAFILFWSFSKLNGQGWDRDYPNHLDVLHDAFENPRGGFVLRGILKGLYFTDENGDFTDSLPLPPKVGNLSSSLWSPDDPMIVFNNQNEMLLGRAVSLGIGENDVIQLAKYDVNNNLLWNKLLDLPEDLLVERILGIHAIAQGGYYLLITNTSEPDASKPFDPMLVKITEEGEIEWRKIYPKGFSEFPCFFLKHNEEAFSIAVQQEVNQRMVLAVMRIDLNGEVVWEKQFALDESHNYFQAVSHDEKLTFMDLRLVWDPNVPGLVQERGYRLITLDEFGEVLNEASGTSPNVTQSNRILVWSKDHFSFFFNTSRGFHVWKFDENGERYWERFFTHPYTKYAASFNALKDGGLIIAGKKFTPFIDRGVVSSRPFVIRLDQFGHTFPNIINGNVFEDLDEDCLLQNEPGLNQWFVRLEGDKDDYTLADSAGAYQLAVPEGNYQIQAIGRSPYWKACVESYELSVGLLDSVEQDLPASPIVECPYLEIDLGTPFLRRCFETTYTVRYCNQGTAKAEDAYVEIELDPYLHFISATRPSSLSDQLLTVPLGDVEVGACDQFQFVAYVDCDSTLLGQTHCVNAHIYPDALCLPTDGWSGASVRVDAVCVGDSVRFLIQNIGTAPTTIPVNYIIVEDQVMLRNGNAGILGVGQTVVVSIPSDGGTYFLEAEQEPNHPGNNRPTVVIQGCGAEEGLRLGFFNQFPENDGDPFVSIDCRSNIGSYDPNDKQAFPAGLRPGTLNSIAPNTNIEYMIRFQNTGTDTAFNVRIVDPISEHLDVSSIQLGASSHPYRMELGEENILVFYFENIHLPDSNTNEAASHGFVKFRIDQKKDLPILTRIDNQVAIYFDFNEPVLTNNVRLWIERPLILTSTKDIAPEDRPKVRAWPNPAGKSLTIEVEGESAPTNRSLAFYDLKGKLLRTYSFSGQQLRISLDGLPAGLYYYTVREGKRLVGRDKIVVVNSDSFN